ncbi:hypothetical protein BH09PSE1_BH09PSE1_29870 [soil metagenome]
MRMTVLVLTAFLFLSTVVISVGVAASAVRAQSRPDSPLKGVWTLVAADVRHPDGTVGRDYGAAPAGLLIAAADGHYALQIFDTSRPRFASGDKATGTPEEYRGTVMGQSTHFGTVAVDRGAGTLTFNIEQSAYANWNATSQRRQYELNGDELSYRVPARANGDVPISIWRRVAAD